MGKERGGGHAVGPEKERGVRAHVPAAGKVLEGDDQPTLSALYYDNNDCFVQVKSLCFDHSGTYLAVAGSDVR